MAKEAGLAEGSGAEQQRVSLVTGSTSGLGAEVARRLAARGHHVLIHGRRRERGEALVAEIEAARLGGGEVSGEGSTGAGPAASLYTADLADLSEVWALADAVRSQHDRLDVLINNAGVWVADGERRESADGYELHFAVNYLAHFALTRKLLPLLETSAPSRIVNVASGAQEPLDFDDLMLRDDYSPGSAYARSKLAQVLFTVDLAEELEGRGVAVAALHPATLMDTRMVREAGVRPRSSVEEGAEAVLRIVTTPDLESGRYFDGTRPARAHDQAYEPRARRELRRRSEALVE